MNLIRFAIQNPVTSLVGVILIVLFGAIGLSSMPYQLSPSVTEPELTVNTTWTGATPYEVEREIIEEQEKVLKGIPGLVTMESESFNSRGRITLRFAVGTDVNDALLRVSNKLDEVPEYPDNVEKPVLSATGASSSPIIWMMLKTLPENQESIDHYRTYFEDEVRQYLERVPGVADLFVFGGTEDEMHVIVDPASLAAYGLTVGQVVSALGNENVNVSAGSMELGRREYRIRTVGEFNSPEDIERVVLTSSGQRRVTVGDVARVTPGYAKKTVAMLHNGDPGIVCGVRAESGANVLTITDAVEAVVQDLNQGKLKERGLFIDWASDQRPYINGAIDLVRRNILLGGALAVIVLLTFLRSFSSTVVVAVAIPISAIGTFIVMQAMGRTLNVVSLAGISFAVGMLVDNAIVVLENIDRHRRMGKSAFTASYDGTREVWGAILASTATTVAVFLPVVFMEEEAGQLFKDIAIAVTSAILLSMAVSITVIPMLTNLLLGISKKHREPPLQFVNRLGGWFAAGVMGLVGLAIRNWFTRLATVLLLTFLAVGVSWALFPKMEYLPQGNRNLVLNILVPPPGLSYGEREAIGKYVADAVIPHIHNEDGEIPAVSDQFFVGAAEIMIFGMISDHEQQAGAYVPWATRLIHSIPGMFGVSLQAGIFQDRLGKGRTIDVDVSAPDMNRLVAATGAMFGAIRQAIPGVQIRPLPSLELIFPEVEFRPDRDRLRAAGLTTRDLGVAIDVLMDGRKVGDFNQVGRKKIDLTLKAPESEVGTPEDLYRSLVAAPGNDGAGRLVPVASLAELVRTTGITQIRHLERQRTITLQVTPPLDVPLEAAMDTIRDGVAPKLQGAGALDGATLRLSGSADKLSQTREAMQWNFVLAVAIVYLLMAALFANFIYPLVILFTVPLAGAGGILGLTLENLFVAPQPMDVLTMMGFVLLIGVVVNNAILIVHQSLNNIRHHGMGHREAVLESVRSRVRPIYMSATTSVFGMLPLAIAPGPGSELYRGLGSVVLGGLALSTVFTVFVTPAMLMFVIGMESRRSRREQERAREERECAERSGDCPDPEQSPAT